MRQISNCFIAVKRLINVVAEKWFCRDIWGFTFLSQWLTSIGSSVHMAQNNGLNATIFHCLSHSRTSTRRCQKAANLAAAATPRTEYDDEHCRAVLLRIPCPSVACKQPCPSVACKLPYPSVACKQRSCKTVNATRFFAFS